jgi:hypothetical protein
MIALLLVFVAGAHYVLGLSSIVAVLVGGTCAYVVALLINRALLR